MHRIQELVRLHRQGRGARRVAALLSMSPNTERRYRLAIAPHGLLTGDPDQLPDLAVLKAIIAGSSDGAIVGVSCSVDPWMEQIETLWKKGAKPTAIHTRLKLDESEFSGSVSAVKRACLRLRRQRGPRAMDIVIPVEPVLGEAQVDFGEVRRIYDPATKSRRRTYVFLMVLSGSGRIFARLVHDQRIETWIQLHIEAFLEFGGVPHTIVPDNLKSAVLKAAFGRSQIPHLNQSYRELARHFGFIIDPTPPYSPEKKGRVEVGVRYVKTSYFSTIADDLAIDGACVGLQRWVDEHANIRVLRRTGARACDFFESTERKVLLALPDARFETIIWADGLVHADSHLNFQKRVYSVPWRFVGKTLNIRATKLSVEIYHDDVRVATHERSYSKYRVTDDLHLPDRRVELRHREPSYWIEKAEKLHPLARELVEYVFQSDTELSQLRQVQEIVMLLETCTPERIESSCKRALFYGLTRYVGLRDMLENRDDLIPLPTVDVPDCGSARGYRFARSVSEMLNQDLEYTNEPN